MNESNINTQAKLSEHFSLGEMIKCLGIEQAIRYATILLDIADGTKRDFDELLIERSPKGNYWLHFAVRTKENRRKVRFIQTT